MAEKDWIILRESSSFLKLWEVNWEPLSVWNKIPLEAFLALTADCKVLIAKSVLIWLETL